ncbi:alpha/beta hydrolase [Pedobacter frigiditerrae]|uniref:Alpha/beta hydrolase n=1 Tax=Pedobacter frigiditerrae TaxID=2530452 RepID=A0A4R0MNY9_9SPHI|nr:alpha/beta hydrolase [Pedobacter frigiditerrae]TCC88515.1 alpha/beta hydrolase [Pedobacter frigiditerrae]
MEYQSLKYIYQAAPIQPAATLLLLHGTGGNETDLLPLASNFGNNINILSVRGNVTEHGMPRFFKRLGMGIFDEKDLSFRTQELIHFLRETSKKENFDINKVIALGYSNGANIAGAVLIDEPGLLAGAILFRPMQPYKQLPAFKAVNQAPVLLTLGQFDTTIDPDATNAYVTALQNNGFATTAMNLSTGHNLIQEDISLALDWYHKNFSNGNI